jgi:hypothetical protein
LEDAEKDVGEEMRKFFAQLSLLQRDVSTANLHAVFETLKVVFYSFLFKDVLF